LSASWWSESWPYLVAISGKRVFMQKAVFLDRDGTIIEDSGYVAGRERVKFLPRSPQAIKLLNENGYKVIVISNQAGVARGYFSEEAVKETNRYIQESLARQGALINRFYYCPHHIEGVIEEYRKECYDRKPNPGMIEQAKSDFMVDLNKSFVIGDRYSDIEAGLRAGCRTVLLGNGAADGEEITARPHRTARDLYEAVEWLLDN
jgi:D-glycero-D-manno-heptose 1,7-bisphosphate phosphatase